MLTRVGEGLWEEATSLRVIVVESGRRMTVAKLGDGGLWIHSPAELTPRLRSELDELGPVRFVVPASKLHGNLFTEDYLAAFPEAQAFRGPGAGDRKGVEYAGELGDTPDPGWAAEFDQLAVRGTRFVTEVVFLHRASRTLIVGDLLWSLGAGAPASTRLWVGGGEGVRPTRAFRRAIRDRDAFRESLDRVLGWDFDRIQIGHGDNVEGDAKRVLRDAYAFLD
jgi:hypothetical protein